MKNKISQELIRIFKTKIKFKSLYLHEPDLNKGGINYLKNCIITNTVSSIPIENLLVETDSPYLAPLPYRGKFNEPSYIVHTIDKLSEIKRIPKKDIMIYTTNNFKKLFNL